MPRPTWSSWGVPPGAPSAGGSLGRLVALGERWGRRLDPGLPPLALVADLLTGGPAARAVRGADVVDLQWSEQVRLVRLVRRLAPGARVVGTYHDVQSQLFAREPSATAVGQLAWRWRAARARVHERRAVAALDAVVVFSDKDAALLGRPDRLHVVAPPLAPAHPVRHAPPPGPPLVLLVGHLARPENDDGARWLLREVWPHVVAAVPDARVRLVGAGAGPGLVAAAGPGVELAGYVPDLDAEYAAAWCCVVPVRTGAGVKFKAVEALVHGVPVVATTVGAEGVGGPEWFAAVEDDPGALASAVVAVLRAPEDARERAAAVQDLAGDAHGPAAFDAAVRSAYRLGAGVPPLS